MSNVRNAQASLAGSTLAGSMGSLVALVIVAAPSSAQAACITEAPPIMYLGANAVYDIELKLSRQDRCNIDFQERGEKVLFQSLKPVREPEFGKLKRVSDFVYDFEPEQTAQSDYFTLKLCGSDIKGPGCSTLRYKVMIR